MNPEEILNERILLLDGSMGVELRKRVPDGNEIKGFSNHHRPLSINPDILNLARPEVVASVHDAYLEAGADIIETNTFNSNSISQREYATEHMVRDLNLTGARIAVQRARHYTRLNPARPRFVAGVIGPTAFPLSFSTDSTDALKGPIDFETLEAAYTEQASALLDGGVDLLLIETVFDLQNAKAALSGTDHGIRNTGRKVPIMISMTISEATGKMVSGHTPEEILPIAAPYLPAAIGFNCVECSDRFTGIARRFAKASPYPLILYPNAGLPDSRGEYHISPEQFLAKLTPLLEDGLINIVGGCCGTTPDYIYLLNRYISSHYIESNSTKRSYTKRP